MRNSSFILSILLLGLSLFAAATIASRKPPAVAQIPLKRIPMQIGDFTATNDSFSRAVYEELNADYNLYRHYRSPDGRLIDLYIGYYGTAKGGRTGHNPYACLPGAGWGILEDQKVVLKNEHYPEGAKVNYLLTRKNTDYQVIYHWYQSAGDKVLDSGLEQNIQRFVGSVFHNRNDGAFIRVSLPASRDDAIEEKKKLGKWFCRELLAILPDYWPVEKEL